MTIKLEVSDLKYKNTGNTLNTIWFDEHKQIIAKLDKNIFVCCSTDL